MHLCLELFIPKKSFLAPCVCIYIYIKRERERERERETEDYLKKLW